MIPDWGTSLTAFGVAAVFFTAMGLPLARAVAPRFMPPLAMAPALGWAAYTVVGLPLLRVVGFSATAISLYALAAAGLAAAYWRRVAPPPGPAGLPRWSLALAAIVAWLPAAAIMPKPAASGILLAPPMFDHVKIAVVDAILRDGLPVINPFYGPDNHAPLAYYYLWHFSTAMLASFLHIGGWSAEAAMTGFTAFASLLLMMGLVVGFGGSRLGIAAVAVLSLPGSLRPLLAGAIGRGAANGFIPRRSDLGGWLNQAAWVPQHLASACCVILAALLILRLADAGTLLVAAALGLTVAAGFESSVWVGGVAFAAAAPVLGLWLLWRMPQAARIAFLGRASAAALLAAVLVLPFVAAELRSLQARHLGGALAILPYPTLGRLVPAGWRRLLDLPAFWLVLLPIALPAVVPLGVAGLWRRLRPRDPEQHHSASPAAPLLQPALLAFGVACLVAAWLLRSTIDNNDLGWRSILPPLLLLTAFAARVLERAFTTGRWRAVAAALVLAAAGAPDSLRMLRGYFGGQSPGDAAGFAAAAALWQAVRQQAAPDDRIGNNPASVAAATPWPVNIAWATLSDRPSCYAGWETVIAYGSLTPTQMVQTDARFERVFAGQARAGDVLDLARRDNCSVVAVTPQDGAWTHDPFAGGQVYRLVASGAQWRIYRRLAP